MFDYCIKNGEIADGSGDKLIPASVYIEKGKIALITKEDYPAAAEIDAEGKIVAPGFIDVHSHSDKVPFTQCRMEGKISQGITTEIVGNCGMSAIPEDGLDLEKYASMFQNTGCFMNIAMLVGHGTLREHVMGMQLREPKPWEMDRMKSLLDLLLKQGAAGMSVGLVYAPSSFASTKELIELAKVVRENDKIFTAHIRNENKEIGTAIDEMIHVAEESGVHMHISHLKLMGVEQWGKANLILSKLRRARERGIWITADHYPYTASSTSLGVMIPKWAHEGGFDSLCERLQDKSMYDKIRNGIEEEAIARGGSNRINISFTNGSHPEIEGLSLQKISEEWNMSVGETVLEIYTASHGISNAIYHCISQEDMIEIMREPYICVGTDGEAMSLDKTVTKGNPHCRAFGTFPRFIETIREQNLFDIPRMVYKMTGLAAECFQLRERGYIREGYAADICIFTPAMVKDTSRYENSVCKPEGIDYVMVNGKIELENGKMISGYCGNGSLIKI